VLTYIRNLVLIAVGFYLVQYFLTTLITTTDASSTLVQTVIPTMIAIGGAIYAVVGAMRLTKMGKED
jgi:uncharacterized membrane protein YidH (DUF202 family)